MDTPPPVLPPGCSLRGRTLHLGLDLAGPGAEEGPDSHAGAVVLALDAARYYGLSVTLGGEAQTSPAGRVDQAALDREEAAARDLERLWTVSQPCRNALLSSRSKICD